jgi:hypothetical protein
MTLSILGIVGGILFALAPSIAVYKTIKAKKALGTPVSLSVIVCLGTIVQYVYLVASYGFDTVLFLNYLTGLVLWLTLLYYGAFRNALRNRTL